MKLFYPLEKQKRCAQAYICFVDIWVLWSMMSSIIAPYIILLGQVFPLTDTLLRDRPRACTNLQEHTNEHHDLDGVSSSHPHFWISLLIDLHCTCSPGIFWGVFFFFFFRFVLATDSCHKLKKNLNH